MDKHDENCSCCNEDEIPDTITLTLEDDTEVVCDIIAIFPCNDNNYIALLPQDAGEDGEFYLYRYTETDDDEVDLQTIEDDAEFEAVSDAFDELLDSEEFDEMFEDDDTEE